MGQSQILIVPNSELNQSAITQVLNIPNSELNQSDNDADNKAESSDDEIIESEHGKKDSVEEDDDS